MEEVELRAVKFCRVVEELTRRVSDERAPERESDPPEAVVKKKFVVLALVAKKLVVVAEVVVELTAVKF